MHHLLCAKHYSMSIANINSYNYLNNPMKGLLLLHPFDRGGNWGVLEICQRSHSQQGLEPRCFDLLTSAFHHYTMRPLFFFFYNIILVLPYVDMNPPQFYFKHVLKGKELCYIRKNAECEVATVGFVFVRFLILGLSSYSYKTPEKVTLLSSTVK